MKNATPGGHAADTDGSVGVVIAAMNAQLTIARAVRSALDQTHVTEVVVVDDASTDATEAVTRSADDGSGRLRVLRLLHNRGPAAARNLALKVSATPFVALLDADDYFMPGRIARLLADAPAEWDFLADDIVIVPKALAHHQLDVTISSTVAPPSRLDLADFVLGNISERTAHRGELGFLKPIMRRSFLDQSGLRYDESMRLGEDYSLYVRAIAAGARFFVTRAAGYVAIERPESLSALHGTRDLERIAAFDAWCLNNLGTLNRAERRALEAHKAATSRKVAHGHVLDARRDRGYLSALGVLARWPQAFVHIAKATLRAKWPSRQRSAAFPAAAPRLLIGPSGGGGVRWSVGAVSVSCRPLHEGIGAKS